MFRPGARQLDQPIAFHDAQIGMTAGNLVAHRCLVPVMGWRLAILVDGALLHKAVHDASPDTLNIVLETGKATPDTLSRAVHAFSELPPTPEKASKLEAVLRRTRQQEAIDNLLACVMMRCVELHLGI